MAKFIRDREEFKFFDKKSYLTIGNGDGKAEYSPVERNHIHIGQLKLLMSELELLVYYVNTAIVKTVLYIGSAPGDHIYVLNKLFPEITFYLYDEVQQDERIQNNPSIIINKKYFDNKELEKWKTFSQPFILISDIRNLGVGNDLNQRIKLEWSDMLLQQKWVEELKPDMALLKFKLPYQGQSDISAKYHKYLDGTLMRQLFPRKNSTETRLLVRGIAYRLWDAENYEKMMAYHNQDVRTNFKFLNPITNDESPIYPEKGLYNNFESTAMAVIIMDYLKKVNMSLNKSNFETILNYILNNCYHDKKINLQVSEVLS